MYRSAAGIKCVTVGDGTVGKTCMLVSYANNRFPREHVPTVFDNYAVTVMAGEQPINLMLFDTAGQEDYDRLRVLCYPGSDVIVLCFCVTNPASFLNIEHKWVPELKLNCPGVPIVLVGTKVDLRDDQEVMERLQKKRERPITSKKGEKLAARIGATCYIECSALTQKGLKDVYDSAILSVIEPKKSKPKQSSSILSCIRR